MTEKQLLLNFTPDGTYNNHQVLNVQQNRREGRKTQKETAEDDSWSLNTLLRTGSPSVEVL